MVSGFPFAGAHLKAQSVASGAASVYCTGDPKVSDRAASFRWSYGAPWISWASRHAAWPAAEEAIVTDEKRVEMRGDQLVEAVVWNAPPRFKREGAGPLQSRHSRSVLPARLVGISTSISKAVPAARRSEIATEETAAVRNSGVDDCASRPRNTVAASTLCPTHFSRRFIDVKDARR